MSPFGEGETWLNKSSQRPPDKHVGLNWDSFEDRHKDARLVMMWNNKRKCSSFWKRLKTITQNLPIVFHCPSLYHSTRNKLKELQSLLGKLNFVSQCIHPGRIFVIKKQHKTVIVKYCHNVNVLKVLFYIGGEEGKIGVKRHGRRLRWMKILLTYYANQFQTTAHNFEKDSFYT